MQNNNHEWLKRCFNCMEPVDAPDAECAKCGWDNHNRENGNAALEQTVLKDQYIVGKSLGRGGFGITYVGFDITLERRIAIKEYFPVGTAYRFSDGVTIRAYTEAEEDYQNGLNQALQESRTIAKLGQIPNVMQVHNAFLENGTVYMIMEYIDGISLAEEVKQKGKLSWKEALQRLYPIMDALEKIHAKGMIHRDISPENIIRRNETGEPVLLDFGSARQPKEGLTVMLKPGYAPAEQYSRNGEQDGRVDEYALCATMYFLLTGNAPASADLRMFAKKELKRPSEYADDIPAEIEKVLLKGMELDSSDRYSSVKELHDAFLKAEQEAGKSGRTVKPLSPRSEKIENQPEKKEKTGFSKKIAGIVAAIAVACLGGFLLFGNASRDRDTEKEAAVSSTQENAAETDEKEAAVAEEKAASMPEPTATVVPESTVTPTTEPTFTPTPEPEETVVAEIEEEPKTAFLTTATSTPSPELTATNTPTPEPTATDMPTPEPTATNTPTPEPTVTNTPTPEPTATNTPTPEPTATNTPTPEPTATNTPTPTATPIPDSTAMLTPESMEALPAGVAGDSGLPVMHAVWLTDSDKKTRNDYEKLTECNIPRGQITKISFEKSIASAPKWAWDFSQNGDGSVLVWISGDDELKIAGEGGVQAPKDSTGLFGGYFNLQEINFDGLDTSKVTDMSSMFAYCETLENLDVTSLDTSNVTNMSNMFTECHGLTSVDLSNFETSNVTDMSSMFSGCSALKSIDVSSFDTSNVKDMNHMFSGCSALPSIDLSEFDTSNVTNMSRMFIYCKALQSIDVSNFDTSNVTNMSDMFSGCSALPSIDLSSFDTSKVTDMRWMFDYCSELQSVDVSSFDTSNVTHFMSMFDVRDTANIVVSETFVMVESNVDWTTPISRRFPGNIILDGEILKLEEWLQRATISAGAKKGDSGSTVKWVQRMLSKLGYAVGNADGSFGPKTEECLKAFQAASGLTPSGIADKETIDALCKSGLKAVDLPEMRGDDSFEDILLQRKYKSDEITEVKIKKSLTNAPETAWDISAKGDRSVLAWVSETGGEKILTIAGKGGVKAPERLYHLFFGYDHLRKADLRGLDTSNVTDMKEMFAYCKELTWLEVGEFDTSNVSDMKGMFEECEVLSNIDVSDFDTSNVTNMSWMFGGCKKLTGVDVSNFDTSNVTDMRYMFSFCENLRNIDVSNFDTSNVSQITGMFVCCKTLESIDASSFVTSKVTDMSDMFSSCYALTSIDVSNFDTSNVTDMESMFSYCKSLESINVSGFDTSNVIEMSHLFDGCESLKSIDVSNFDTSNVVKMYGMFSSCRALTSIDLSSFDTSNVTDMSYMFSFCNNLTNINISSFDTSNVTNMHSMFSFCKALKSIDMSNFDTSQADTTDMFYGCDNL